MQKEIKPCDVDIYNSRWWRLVTTAPPLYDINNKLTRTICYDYVKIHLGHHDLELQGRLVEVNGFENAEIQKERYYKANYQSYWLAELRQEAEQFPDFFIFNPNTIQIYYDYVNLSELIYWPCHTLLNNKMLNILNYLTEVGTQDNTEVLEHDFGATYEIRVRGSLPRLQTIVSYVTDQIKEGRNMLSEAISTTGVI